MRACIAREAVPGGDDDQEPRAVLGGEVECRRSAERERPLEECEGIQDPARPALVADVDQVGLERQATPRGGEDRVEGVAARVGDLEVDGDRLVHCAPGEKPAPAGSGFCLETNQRVCSRDVVLPVVPASALQ